uniref:RxLR effector protein n=1 Tax=Phytophthora agathidicida TaxID=1642459 RepID=A0A7G4WI29_9STRA|nr:PaRXLR40 [Phytophthora agathidicida]
MRSFIYVTLAVAALSAINAVATTEVQLSSETSPLAALDSTPTTESRQRFLRRDDDSDDDLDSFLAADEERTKLASELSKVTKLKLKPSTSSTKSLAVAAKKMKETVPVHAINLKDSKFSHWVQKGWAPDFLRKMGKIKNPKELAEYKQFYARAQKSTGA